MQAIGAFLVQIARDFWPFRKVEPWEQGMYVVFGHPWKIVGPGYYYPVIPWFMDVIAVNTRVGAATMALHTVTMPDGDTISYSGVAMLRVFDIRKALMGVEYFKTTTTEMLPGWVTKEVMQKNTPAGIQHLLNAKLKKWGIECQEFRFTNYVTGVLTIRALTDTATSSSDW